jgi:outer membrane protein OmpA-like peptidoglycan-associated protein
LTTGRIDRCEVRLRVGSHVLARGTRSSVAGADTLRVGLRLTAYGRRLLHRRLGGRLVKAVATDGRRTATVRTRAILAVEHITTPPGSFKPSQAELTQSGRRFLRRLRDRLIAVSSYRCEGHTAAPELTAARSERALALSLARAKLVCGALRRVGASGKGRPVARGGTRPIAPNATAPGRAKNRRVEIFLRH